MDLYTLLALVLCFSCAMALARLPVFAWADAPPDHAKRRVSNLDGLRGFLALAVVMYHGAIYRGFLATGLWQPASSFSLILGQVGVSVFFMLTGYLFWRRLVLSRGRMDWLRLYIGRVFRIGPVFLLAAGLAILVSFQAGRHVHLGHMLLAKQIGYYLFLGLLPAVAVHGYDTNIVLAGVTWSLQYEWIFYFCLPLLAILTRARRLHVVFAGALFVLPLLSMWYGVQSPGFAWHPELVCLFGAGAFTASLQQCGAYVRSGETAQSALGVLLIGLVLFGFDSAGEPKAILMLAAFFYLVATGSTLFGLLRLRASHRLGHISYGLYLLQGLALAAVLRPLHKISTASPILHVLLVVLASVLLVFMSLAAHRWVELPGMRLGDRVARWACARRDALFARTPPAGAVASKE